MNYEVWLDENDIFWIISNKSFQYVTIIENKKKHFESDQRNDCLKWLENKGLKQFDYLEIYV